MTDTIGLNCINVRSTAEYVSQLHLPHGTIFKQYDKRKKRNQKTDKLRRNGTGMRKRSLYDGNDLWKKWVLRRELAIRKSE